MRKINYKGKLLCLSFSNYMIGGGTSIEASTISGGTWGRLTINLTETHLAEGEIVLDSNKFPNVLDVLVDNKVVKDTRRVVKTGWCTYPIVRLLS